MKKSVFYPHISDLEEMIYPLEKSWEQLEKIPPSIGIFGSSVAGMESKYYELAEELAFQLATLGWPIITGGGQGIMMAANKGAQRGHTPSIGLYMDDLNEESTKNSYVDPQYAVECSHFFIRKLALLKKVRAIVCLPGGYGTLDELTEFLVAKSVGSIGDIPIFLLGKSFWEGFLRWMEEGPLKEGYIGSRHLKMLQVVDSVDAIVHRMGTPSVE